MRCGQSVDWFVFPPALGDQPACYLLHPVRVCVVREKRPAKDGAGMSSDGRALTVGCCNPPLTHFDRRTHNTFSLKWPCAFNWFIFPWSGNSSGNVRGRMCRERKCGEEVV